MNNKKKILLIIGILAFAAVTYIFLFKGDTGADGKGLRHFKVVTIKSESGWGYRILEKNTPIIEQLNVPGIPGNKGFTDEQSALKTGKLVAHKLENGVFPPSVSTHELDSLGIRY